MKFNLPKDPKDLKKLLKLAQKEIAEWQSLAGACEQKLLEVMGKK